jgi:hypothetical protein
MNTTAISGLCAWLSCLEAYRFSLMTFRKPARDNKRGAEGPFKQRCGLRLPRMVALGVVLSLTDCPNPIHRKLDVLNN